MATAIIIGHSFISGLNHHLANANGGRLMSPYQVAGVLEITHRFNDVVLTGTPGGKVCSYKSNLPHGALRRCRPEIAVLQYGTNDLAGGVPPKIVAEEVLAEAKTLLEVYYVRHVIICSALYRESGVMDPKEFLYTVREYNDWLYRLCAEQPFIGFHSHDGFWGAPVRVWSRDGIHPNTIYGRAHYKKSLRQALFVAFSEAFTPLQ